ncbi:MAG: hypothetical protein WEB85_16265 [Dongiaceae bacterium]
MAGLAGGAAEVIWVWLYASLSTAEAAAVASGVTGTVWPVLATSSAAVPLGIVIHMALAIVLGIAVAVLVPSVLPRSRSAVLEPVTVVGILIAVWAINFLVILPIVNPAFTGLLPYGATLASKVLFGLAAASVLRAYRGGGLAIARS